MSYQPYSLEIVSQHSDSKGKNFKKYALGGEETIGAWHDEPFEIVFRNNSWKKVQVKISIDGTDVLTGELADTQINNKMWVVDAYKELRLKAWPETNEAGAQFVFTSGEKSVAVHTHGDLSSRGVIAAAVFTEGYSPSFIKFNDYNSQFKSSGFYKTGNYFSDHSILRAKCSLGEQTLSSNTITNCVDAPAAAAASFELESLASVGAGEQVSQTITTASGLYQPIFNSIVKVKYVWWADLLPKLQEGIAKDSCLGTGFPGDRKKLMSLGTTPRIETQHPIEKVAEPQHCFNRF